MCGTTAMMYAELCARFPSNGSAFAYVYATFGELAAWIIGWNILPFYGAAASGLARGLVSYMVGFVTKLGFNVPSQISNFTVLGLEDCNPLAALIMCIICLLNFQDTKTQSTFNNTLTTIKLIALSFIIIVALS